MDPACLAACIDATTRITCLVSNNQSITALCLANSSTIRLISSLLAGSTDFGRRAAFTRCHTGDTALVRVKVLAIWTVNRPELKFLTYSVRILIEALRTDASVSDRAKLGVQRALGTSSLEREFITTTAELANSTGIERKTSPAYASSIGDNLVECA